MNSLALRQETTKKERWTGDGVERERVGRCVLTESKRKKIRWENERLDAIGGEDHAKPDFTVKTRLGRPCHVKTISAKRHDVNNVEKSEAF